MFESLKMPPRKSGRKRTATSASGKQSGSGGSQGSPDGRKRLCDGCADTIPTTADALKCSICQVWLHRYCAGIPMSRYATAASSFVCSACSIMPSTSIVAELRSEIAALKAEVSELRTALNVANQKLDKELCEQGVDGRQNTSTADNTGRGRAAQSQQRHSNRRMRGLPRQGTSLRPPRATRATPVNRRKPCVPVEGKRKIWGTRKTTTAGDITRTINSHTSIKTGLTVKRKYKSKSRYPYAISKWWFVVSGEENLLQQLQGEWSTVSNHTEGKWSLESLLCYDPESTLISSNPVATAPTDVHESPNPHQQSAGNSDSATSQIAQCQ